MSTLNEQLYIDGVVVIGKTRTFSVQINQVTEETQNLSNPEFEPMDLSPYNIRFRLLGSAEGNGIILLEKIITQTTNRNTIGIIEEPTSGEFTFVITNEESLDLGLGNFSITLELMDADTEELIYTLTEGGIAQGEFNKIQIVRN